MSHHIGLIREGKMPPDKRVALSPAQCQHLLNVYPELKITVQPSTIRAFPDKAYETAGIPLSEDLSSCDTLMGIKEVPIEELVPGKTYFFFSHTIKEQEHNRDLLKAVLDKKIELIDYEVLKDRTGHRVIGFGRYAGIVGAYNGLLAYGKKQGLYDLKPAHQCEDRSELEHELHKVTLPPNTRILLTGRGRVGKGAVEILDQLNIKPVFPADHLRKNFDHPVYTILDPGDYYARKDGSLWDKQYFYNHPEEHVSTFPRYTKQTDLYIACHYWDPEAPGFFSHEDVQARDFRIKVIADISCDIDGPIPTTLRTSSIEEPLYGYDRQTGRETQFLDENAVGIMAVDNLPCELPKDASEDFGKELIQVVLPPYLGEDKENMIGRATIAHDGHLAENFKFLEGYVGEK